MRKYVWSRACSWLSIKVINGHICCGDKWHFSPLCHNGRSVSVSFRRRVCVAVWMRSVDCIDLCTCLSGRVTALNSSPRRCHSHFPGCHKATGRAQIRLTRLKRAVSRLSPCSIQLSVTTAPPKIIEVEGTGEIGFHVCVCVCAERRVWCEVFGKHWLIKFQCQALGSGTSSRGGVPNMSGDLWGLEGKEWWVQVGVWEGDVWRHKNWLVSGFQSLGPGGLFL